MKKDKRRLKIMIGIIVLFLITGTLFYTQFENLTVLDAFYLSAMTITTVGYGDFFPITSLGKIFTSIYTILGLGILLETLSLFFKIRIVHKNQVQVKNLQEELIKEKEKNKKRK